MIRALLAACAFCFAVPAAAQSLVVVEVRGIDLKVGSRVDEARPVKLPAGGKLVVVRTDGTVISLRGPHDGPLKSKAPPKQGAGRALATLVATRNDRANRVGAVRSGANAAPLPSPWLIDVTRPGERCLVEGAPFVWWQPARTTSSHYALFPIDRSWNALFRFEAGQSTLTVAKVSEIEMTKAFIIKDDEREYSIRLHLIPEDVTEPAVLAGWMIQKGCIQQADALLAELQQGTNSDDSET